MPATTTAKAIVGTAGDIPNPAHSVIIIGRKIPRIATPIGQTVCRIYTKASISANAANELRLITPLLVIRPAKNAAPPVDSITEPSDMMVPHMSTMPQGTAS